MGVFIAAEQNDSKSLKKKSLKDIATPTGLNSK